MKRLWKSIAALLVILLGVPAMSAASESARAAASSTNESELLTLGFKVLVATTPAQREWVKNLAPGQMRPMQRNGKHYFIYPAASKNQIYVGGSQQYQAYRRLHPEANSVDKQRAQEAANSAYRARQDDVMEKATAHDLSDPFLGVSWADLGW